MQLFDGKAFNARCAPRLHPADQTHLGTIEGMSCPEYAEPITRHWVLFYQQLAQFANVCGRNWLAERTPVSFAESAYDVAVDRLDQTQARAIRAGAFDPGQTFVPIPAQTPRRDAS